RRAEPHKHLSGPDFAINTAQGAHLNFTGRGNLRLSPRGKDGLIHRDRGLEGAMANSHAPDAG
ncbi:hypothetical protein, partial [Serratia marcescens]|uniref:hypothetical protein n=1 Tax=Serratia marcescens TaxID=615 RepID=UPI001953C6DC